MPLDESTDAGLLQWQLKAGNFLILARILIILARAAVPFVETERLGFPPPVDEARNFDGVFLAHEQWKYCTAINSILVWLRCFEHLRAFPFMGYIVKVLASAVSPILVVCISFSIVTYAFALAYVLAFSGGVHGYRSIEYCSAKVCP
jgi:hypothetical protein